jgi:hypothetical protein
MMSVSSGLKWPVNGRRLRGQLPIEAVKLPGLKLQQHSGRIYEQECCERKSHERAHRLKPGLRTRVRSIVNCEVRRCGNWG